MMPVVLEYGPALHVCSWVQHDTLIDIRCTCQRLHGNGLADMAALLTL